MKTAEYEPFGREWEKEMKKLPKAFLIDMLKRRSTPITKESLLKFGMHETLDPGVPMEKVIVKDGDEEVSLAVTRYFNVDNIALVIRGTGQLLLAVESIEDLETIERLMPTFDSFV